MKTLVTLLLLLSLGMFPILAQLPPDFSDQLVTSDINQAVGLCFDDNGRMYVWEKGGKVWIWEDEVKLSEPLIDLSEEVGNWQDHGLLGFTLHPNFLQNGFFFLLYAVDHHHLQNFGTAAYDPTVSESNQASIGRIVRYTADPATDFQRILAGSRLVLLGETPMNGMPLVHSSHGVGSLVFGEDGSLLVSCGDGASFAGTDVGGDLAGAYAPQALNEGILEARNDIGAFRAQYIESLNGKILRIDPATGDGIPGNPWYDPSEPRAARSRVWALGLRNPYRFSVQPGSGGHNWAEGKPGRLIVGDVGWAFWEEINVVDQGGQNFGWPIYEGPNKRWQYAGKPTRHPDYPNPLHGAGGCNQPAYYFQDLLVQETENEPFWAEACDPQRPIATNVLTFEHQRPILAWSNFQWNTEEQNTYVPAFDDMGEALAISLADPLSPVVGDTFNGNCTIGGAFYQGNAFPEAYQESFFIGDYTGWIRELRFGTDGQLAEVIPFLQSSHQLVDIKMHPLDGCLYVVTCCSASQVRRICFGGNPPPTAVIESDQYFGPSPLTVAFRGDQSSDPDQQDLDYLWDFGDGTTSTEANPSHTFVAAGNAPEAFLVQLTVTDSEGASHEVSQNISLNNSPPQVSISSFIDGQNYTTTGKTVLPLRAEVSDAEHDQTDLTYAWQTILYHNTHFHIDPADEAVETTTIIAGEGCGDESYHYGVRLTVSDPAGLSTVVEQSLFPKCGPPLAEFVSLEAEAFDAFVEIKWQAINVSPNIRFIVQRGQDGIHFDDIGSLESLRAAEWQFVDRQPIWGRSFYRIKVVDTDDVFDFSPLRLSNFPGKPAVLVYPNPAFDHISIELKNMDGTAHLNLIDLQGKVVRQSQWEGQGKGIRHDVFIRDLAPGLYYWQLRHGAQVSVGKVLVRLR
ncbi:MAG: PQQ-dependent sugar dehydrogenase [Bacteroidota bacterium]